jgi:septation ring formation regulator EzrA
MSDTSLGPELQQLSHSLEILIIREPDIGRKEQLRDKLQEVKNIIGKLVDANVAAATQEYAEARESVEQVNAKILVAIQDLAKVAETINNISKALDILEKLLKAAKP